MACFLDDLLCFVFWLSYLADEFGLLKVFSFNIGFFFIYLIGRD